MDPIEELLQQLMYPSDIQNDNSRMLISLDACKCEICGKMLSTAYNLRKHLYVHVPKKSFSCKRCPGSFSRLPLLHAHEKECHGIENTHVYQCEVCHKSFQWKSTLKHHMSAHGPKSFQCEICKKEFSRLSYLQVHARVHTMEKEFKCEVCHTELAYKASLINHMRLHTGEKPFQCDVCLKFFFRKRDCIKHKRNHFNAEDQFKCKLCTKSYKVKDHLHIHTKLKHTGGEKPLFQCKVCNKKVASKENLKAHTRLHTGEKPFQCDVCLKRFIGKNNLKVHASVHTGEKRYQCESCKMRFTQKGTLNTHLKLHCKKRILEKTTSS